MTFKQTRFTEMLIAENNLEPDEFKRWVFWPGMLFNSTKKWWGDYGQRDFPHEGLDFCLYQDGSGRVRRLDETTRIPVMHRGVVRALFKDYLGQAVIIAHASDTGDGPGFLSVYAHTKPQPGIEPGVSVSAGEIIATIADTRQSKANILPHLHVSFGYPSPDLVYEPFVWDCMRDPGQVVLLDPLDAVDWHCQEIAVDRKSDPGSQAAFERQADS